MRIPKYAKRSSLMRIHIDTGIEQFKFNLYQEVKINPDHISRDLKNQPSHYAFLTLLQKQLIKMLGEAELEEKKTYARAYLKYKREISQQTKRPNSDDVAKQKSELNIPYLKSQRKVIHLKHNVGIISSCVSAFEQRKDILQTLSANARKERVS